MARILIADDHAVVRAGVRRILEGHPSFEIVAETADGKTTINKAIETKPDVILLDYSLPVINGLEVTRQVRRRLPGTEVLLFTVHDSESTIEEALKNGARGYLLKTDAGRDLIEAITRVAAHRPFFTNKVTENLLRNFVSRPLQRPTSTLTSRERMVVQLIAEGHSSKQVAKVLQVGLKTVETHRRSIMFKLNLASSAALVRYAVRNKLVEP